MGSYSKKIERRLIQPLSTGWHFKQTDAKSDQWMPVDRVPSVVHLDLLNNGQIPDPFLEFNELDVEWVGEQSWTYQLQVSAPEKPEGFKSILVFEGLDTYASVSLNGQLILQSDNMFMSHTVDVSDVLQHGKANLLRIDFESALLRGRRLKEEYPEFDFIAHNGEPGRLGVRKAQYHWGWDWGPVLMCCGPWRPVRLETYLVKVEDLWADIKVDSSLEYASGTLFARVDGPVDQVQFTLKYGSQVVLESTSSVGRDHVACLDFSLKSPKLWFPYGYGRQDLYELSVVPLGPSMELILDDPVSKNIGFRRVELVQDEDKNGRSFYFRVNNVDIFCGGSCWIPADSFLPRISPDRYRKWLQLMVDGGQVMTRVWGGGVYEEDVFYDICDELGILVWQDFMFACASYPAWPELLENIRQEARCNIRRLRHHPSIILYCGNNEDYQVQELHKLEYHARDENPESWLELKPERTTFPARYIYEHLLPQIVSEESLGAVPYWPSSPFSGGGKLSSDPSLGDVHEWNVWHGTQAKYQLFDSMGGRFVSEFGLEAFPSLKTIDYFVPKKVDRYAQSRVVEFHNKFEGQDRRIASYVAENFRAVADLESYIHCTQMAQADALTYAYSGWRRQWGQDRKCGGVLVWQLNDCWPCISWAIVDYFLRKKPAYYTVSRCLKPVSITVRRQHRDWSDSHSRQSRTHKNQSYALWICNNSALSIRQAEVELRFVSILSGRDIKEHIYKKDITITPNGTTEVFGGNVDIDEESHVLAAKLWIAGSCVSRDVDWPQPLKYVSFSKRRGVEVKASFDSKGGHLLVSAQRPTKGLVFEERDGVVLSDSALDVIPGDKQIVDVKGLAADDTPLGWRFLGQGESTE